MVVGHANVRIVAYPAGSTDSVLQKIGKIFDPRIGNREYQIPTL